MFWTWTGEATGKHISSSIAPCQSLDIGGDHMTSGKHSRLLAKVVQLRPDP